MSLARPNCRWLAAILLVFVAIGFGFSQTGSPPEITEIVFPHETIPTDGSTHSGKVVFKDADGDAKWADFHVKAPDPQALTISDQTPEDGVVRLEVRAPADRQKQGQGIVLFKIAATAPQEVTIRVVLTDEAGNTSDPNDPKATFSFRVRGPQPDLVVSLGGLPEQVQLGQILEASYTVQNLGGSDSGPFRIGVYLSADDNITPEDLLVDSKEIGNLAPDASTTERLRVELTQDLLTRGGLEPGPLFLGVIADDLNQVEESDETNNVASAAIRVVLPPKRPAFFKVVDLSIEPRSPIAGSTVTIKATIENTGEEPGTKPVELYIDGVRRDSRSLTLNPGQRKTVSFSHTFAFTEPPLRVEITVKTPDDEQTLIVTVSQPAYTVCTSGCPFTEIQAAIDSAGSGETITIGPGTYEENLKITKGLTLKGAGSDRTEINGKEEGKPVILIESDSEIEVTLEGLMIAEAKVGEERTYKEDGILIGGRAIMIVRNSKISGNGDDGIGMEGSSQATISDSEISGNSGHGIWMYGSSQATISDSQISGNGWDGILMWGSSKATISGSEISGNGEDGIWMVDSPQATIHGNKIFENKEYGVALYQKPCFDTGWKFEGKVEGSGNEIHDNGDGDVCPSELRFLKTSRGGCYGPKC